MTATDKPRVQKVKRGRNHHYRRTDGGPPIQGVTKIIGDGIPKPALTNWAARKVAELAAERKDTLADMEADEIVDFLKGAPWRDRDRAGNRGTEVHALAEELARGQDIDVPEELVGHVDSYIAFLNDYQPEVLLLETVVANLTHGYAGTLDSILRIPSLGGVIQADIKTNRSGPFGEVALQTCAYERAEVYIDDDGVEQPCWRIGGEDVEIVGSYCLWVRADGYDLVPVDTSEETFYAFLYAKQVAEFVNERSKQVIGDAVAPPARTQRDEVPA